MREEAVRRKKLIRILEDLVSQALDDVVTRLKESVPAIIAAAQAATGGDTDDDAAVVELTTLADQIDAALAGTSTPPADTGNGAPPAAVVDPGAPAI